jgi:hypothetical protein
VIEFLGSSHSVCGLIIIWPVALVGHTVSQQVATVPPATNVLGLGSEVSMGTKQSGVMV